MGSLFAPDVQETTSTMEIPQWAEDAMRDDIARRGGVADREYQGPYQGERRMSFNDLQNSAMGTANMFGNMAPSALANSYNALTDTTGSGMLASVFSGMGDYYDKAMGAGNNAAQGMLSNAVAAQMDRQGVRDISGGSFLDMDRDAYTNQYTQDVSNDVMSDIMRMTEQQQNSNAANANMANAWGGSRSGVQAATLQSEALRNYGQMSNQLNQQAFDAASGLMSQDLQRDLAANQANQQMDFGVGSLNTNATNTARLANAAAANNMSQFNASQRNNMNQYGMSNALAALGGMSDIGNSLARNSLAQGQALQAFGNAGMGAQMGAGQAMQDASMYNQNLDYGDWLEARDWGMNNYLASGGVNPMGNPGGTQTGQQFGPSMFQNILGAGSSIAGMAMKSSRHFKKVKGPTDLEAVAEKVISMPIYDWEYKDHFKPTVTDTDRLGPLAEDFGEAFTGNKEERQIDYQRHISALHATIQHMWARMEDLEAQLAQDQDRSVQ